MPWSHPPWPSPDYMVCIFPLQLHMTIGATCSPHHNNASVQLLTLRTQTPSPRSQTIIAVNVLFSIFATIVVLIRLFTRSKLLHSVGTDDWLILVGLGSAWVLALWNSIGTAWGLGRHVWDIPEENWMGVGKVRLPR